MKMFLRAKIPDKCIRQGAPKVPGKHRVLPSALPEGISGLASWLFPLY